MSGDAQSEKLANPLRHVAVIMDGNNRWAKQRGLAGIAGHERGVERVRDAMDSCVRHNIEFLTVFAFSSENWSRPPAEVRGLMSLFSSYLRKELPEFQERSIRLKVIGERAKFSDRLRKLIDNAEQKTQQGKTTLVLAVDYGGRWDITQAAKKLAAKVQSGVLRPEDISETLFARHLSLADLPPPDLCIRTANERRLSNFLLWHLAYAELYFSPVYWPDFDAEAFDAAVADYNSRQRRFGMTAEQLCHVTAAEKNFA
ncbi:MAG: polyprenyl diphosphate synthase [Porticoccaceae bacterium]|nr:polyprenyl diphosphate synthase [Porticoccaceae bacterium]